MSEKILDNTTLAAEQNAGASAKFGEWKPVYQMHMNKWERWGKLMLKGFLWAPVFLFMCWAVDAPFTWQIFVLVCVCSFWDRLLDEMIPTRKSTDGASSNATKI